MIEASLGKIPTTSALRLCVIATYKDEYDCQGREEFEAELKTPGQFEAAAAKIDLTTEQL